MGADGQRRRWRRAAIVLGAIVIVAGAGIALLNPRITRGRLGLTFRQVGDWLKDAFGE